MDSYATAIEKENPALALDLRAWAEKEWGIVYRAEVSK
jgi:hypothetical protein